MGDQSGHRRLRWQRPANLWVGTIHPLDPSRVSTPYRSYSRMQMRTRRSPTSLNRSLHSASPDSRSAMPARPAHRQTAPLRHLPRATPDCCQRSRGVCRSRCPNPEREQRYCRRFQPRNQAPLLQGRLVRRLHPQANSRACIPVRFRSILRQIRNCAGSIRRSRYQNPKSDSSPTTHRS